MAQRAHVYIAEVEQSDLTCGEHFIGIFASERRAKDAIREYVADVGGDPSGLVWRQNGSRNTHSRYVISTDLTNPDDEGNPWHFSVMVARPK